MLAFNLVICCSRISCSCRALIATDFYYHHQRKEKKQSKMPLILLSDKRLLPACCNHRLKTVCVVNHYNVFNSYCLTLWLF